MRAIKLLQEYMANYTESQKHKTSPAMIKFHLKDHVAAIEEIQQLQARIKELEVENQQLRGEEPIPFAWWKDCPGVAQRTMERIIAHDRELEAEMQKYITLFNLANCYVDITPEHKLFDSIKQDVKACLKRIKGEGEK